MGVIRKPARGLLRRKRLERIHSRDARRGINSQILQRANVEDQRLARGRRRGHGDIVPFEVALDRLSLVPIDSTGKAAQSGKRRRLEP